MDMDPVAAFYRIRDVPYRIPLSRTEPDQSCSGKAKQLLACFREAGLQARYRVCDFSWNDIGLPDAVLKYEHVDAVTHVYLEVFIDGSWITVDPTWDKGLSDLFFIQEWDGHSDTEVAVPVLGLRSLEESEGIMNQEEEEDVLVNAAFHRSLNEWLEEVRNNKA